MLRNVSIGAKHMCMSQTRWLFRTAIVACVAILTMGIAQAGTTQIVVQWASSSNGLSTFQLFQVQHILDDRAQQGGYNSDGNDVGSGTTNFYLYADDKRVDAVVRELITMQQQKLLPDGMQVGIAEYKDANRKDWSYRPAYPATLKHFDITYSGKS